MSSFVPATVFPCPQVTQHVEVHEGFLNISAIHFSGFVDGSVVKNLPARAGDVDSIHQAGKSPGGGNGNPLKYSCLENTMDRGAWCATVRVAPKDLGTIQ